MTVKWSPISTCNVAGCTECAAGTAKKSESTVTKVNSGLAQYNVFGGTNGFGTSTNINLDLLENIDISNVNFEYVPASFNIHDWGDWTSWSGKFTAESVPAAQLYLLNSGNVTVKNCTFDHVVLTSRNDNNKTNIDAKQVTVSGCEFKNISNSYGIKELQSANATVTGNKFTNTKSGIMLSGATAKNVTISDNTFSCDAAKGGELIQIAADFKFDDNSALKITDNTSTTDTSIFRLHHTDIKGLTYSGNNIPESAPTVSASSKFGATLSTDGTLTVDSAAYTDKMTVKVGDKYYATLAEALNAVYMSSPTGTTTIECKAGADVGAMTHAHVEDDLIIKGNGAYVSSGEGDMEFDKFKFSRNTGKEDPNGTNYLSKDVTVSVDNLSGIAAWGTRHSEHTVNLTFTNCKNMNRVYLTGETGVNNITLNNCSFNTNYRSSLTSVYSNNPGTIKIDNCDFTEIAVAVNLNNKSTGKQDITINNCRFTDCGTVEKAKGVMATGEEYDWTNFAAPIRIVTKTDAADSKVSVTDSKISYSDSITKCGNGDILLGDGRKDESSAENVTLNVSGTNAEVQVQFPGEAEKTVKKTVEEKDSTTIDMGSTTTTAAAKIGETSYATLSEAIAAAADGDTITVIGKSEVSSLPSNKNLTFKGDPTDGEDTLKFNAAVAPHNAELKFEDLTFEWPEDTDYVGIQHAKKLDYNNCTIKGRVTLYAGEENFTKCRFVQAKQAYNVWTYGAKVANFNDCDFQTLGKSILVYNEGGASEGTYTEKTACMVNITGCTFNATQQAGKAAVEVDSSLAPFDVAISNSTATGFAAGSTSGNTLYNVKLMKTDLVDNSKDKTSITVNNEKIDLESVRRAGATWDYNIDSGMYEVADDTFGMMRFMFKINGVTEDIAQVGIKYVSADNTADSLGNTPSVSLSKNTSVFQGDIVSIPEETEGTYYAFGFVKTASGKVIWSDKLACTINHNKKFTNYSVGGAE